MPIIGYNPDGTVRIARKSGKDVKNVKPEELKDYNAELEKEYTESFNSAKSVASGDLKLTDLPTDRRETINTLVRTNPNISTDVRNDLAEKAQAVLDTIKQGREGKLKGEAYKDALNAVSSSFKAAKSFGEGGKALTQPELAVLSGQTPDISSREQGWIDKLTGYVPPANSEVKDSEATLERKMKIALKIAKKQKITPEDSVVGEEKPEGLNIGGDIKNILNNLLNIPRDTIENAKNSALEYQKTGDVKKLNETMNPHNAILNMLKGYGQNLYKDVGSPLEGGDVVERAKENFQERPVSTVLDVLPFLGAGKNMLKGKIPTGGDIPKSNPITDTGSRLRAGVRDVDVGPTIGGPQKEAMINKRLDNMGIKGNPEQQYTQLQPKMEEISGQIKEYFKTNSKPIPIDEVKNVFKANLEEQIRSKSLNSKIADKEAKGYIKDLYNSSFGKNLENEIQTSELFELKKKVNQDFKSVEKKINNGTSLSDREKVISIARKTLDDIIAGEHPEIKELTLNQSALYDAAEPLHKNRSNPPHFRIFGNKVPIPGGQQIESAQDLIGRMLQRGLK